MSQTSAALIAAAAGGGPVVHVIAALRAAGLDAADLQTAEQSGFVRIEGGHVVLAAAARDLLRAAAPEERRAAHRALAAAATDQDERLWHEANATDLPEERIATRLVAAAERAGSMRAVELLERAAELSATPAECTARYLEAGRTADRNGMDERALALLARARETAATTRERALVEREDLVIQLRRGAVREPGRLIELAEAVRDDAPELAAELLADAAFGLWHDESAGLAKALDRALRAADSSPSIEMARALVAISRGGDPEAARLRLQRAARGAVGRGDVRGPHVAGVALYWLGQYALARELLQHVVEWAREHDPRLFAIALDTIAAIETRRGSWTRAHEASAEALACARQIGDRWQTSSCLTTLARVEAARGESAACRAHIGEALELADDSPLLRAYALSALGLLCLGTGALEEGVVHLEQLAAITSRPGYTNPAVVPGMPEIVEVYVRARRRQQAAAAFHAFVESTRRGLPAGTGAQLERCAALLAEGEEAERHFRRALEHHAAAEMPFERARTQLCYGEWLRRGRRRTDARRQLERALATFELLGATPWVEHARRELGRAPAPADPDLTPHEVQVASLVAEGATNAEVARALFITPKTVEYHLAGVYRKLGIRNRAALAAAWARRPGSGARSRS